MPMQNDATAQQFAEEISTEKITFEGFMKLEVQLKCIGPTSHIINLLLEEGYLWNYGFK